MKDEPTPGPWEYVPSTEHHGPYITSQFGSTICDFYVMSHPGEPSERNGGKSKPISFMAEMADANAELAVVAINSYRAIKEALGTEEDGEALVEVARNAHRAEMELAALKGKGDK
jgi:hypothetical protein